MENEKTTYQNDFNALLANLAKPAQRALLSAGYQSLEELAGTSESELLGLHGMGPKALKVVRQTLEAKGLNFS